MSRLPNIKGDEDIWDTVLNDFLSQSLNPDGSLKNIQQPINFADNAGKVRAQTDSISGDYWFIVNAYWDPNTQNFYRVDNTHYAFGFQLQGQGLIPGEPDLGFYVPGATVWVAQPASYNLIRGAGSSTGLIFGAVGGWELGWTCTAERQLTIGGGGIEIDGYGTLPYGRVINNTTGTILAKRMVGMIQNAFTDFGGYDDPNQESWYWGYVESYDPLGSTGPPYPVVPGTSHWAIVHQPANTDPQAGVWDEYLTIQPDGQVLVAADPTAALGVATKQYVDAHAGGGPATPTSSGGEFVWSGDGTTQDWFIEHGVAGVPRWVQVSPANQASVGCWYSKDASLVAVHLPTPPASGDTVAFGVSWALFT